MSSFRLEKNTITIMNFDKKIQTVYKMIKWRILTVTKTEVEIKLFFVLLNEVLIFNFISFLLFFTCRLLDSKIYVKWILIKRHILIFVLFVNDFKKKKYNYTKCLRNIIKDRDNWMKGRKIKVLILHYCNVENYTKSVKLV